MEKSRQKLLIAIACLLTILASCSKKSDPVLTRTQLLTQTIWKLSTLTSTDPIVQSTSTLLVGSEWQFKADKSLTVTITFLGISVPSTGTWAISADETQLTMTSSVSGLSSTTTTANIETITAASLQLKETTSGAVVNVYTFAKK